MVEQGLQEHRRAGRVDVGILGDLIHALADADAGRQVDDAVDPLERGHHGIPIPHIAPDQLHVVREVRRRGAALVDLRVDVVQRPDLIAVGEEMIRQVGSDEAGATGDQNSAQVILLVAGLPAASRPDQVGPVRAARGASAGSF